MTNEQRLAAIRSATEEEAVGWFNQDQASGWDSAMAAIEQILDMP